MKRVREDVEASKNEIPEGFIMPTHESTKPVIEKIDDDFWVDSDQEDYDFGGSESDEELNNAFDDDEDEEDDGDEETENNLDSEMTDPDHV